MMMMIMIIMIIIMMMMMVMIKKNYYYDDDTERHNLRFVQSPYCAMNRLQHIHSSHIPVQITHNTLGACHVQCVCQGLHSTQGQLSCEGYHSWAT